MKRLINKAWRLHDTLFVIGQDGSNYIIHFSNLDDHRFMLLNGSIDGALLVFKLWQPNFLLRSHSITNTLIWVQLWGFSLEYQQPVFAQRITQSIGEVSLVDWDHIIPKNIRFM